MEERGCIGISILFVNSEKLIRDSFANELHWEGFAVTAVASGDEAICEVNKGKYDLVITDLMMPDIDGFSILEATKKRFRDTGVIIFTSYSNMAAVTKALDLGADDFTLKPCDIEELVFRIRRCLERQKLLKFFTSQNPRP